MTAVEIVAGTAAEGAAGIAGDTADECCRVSYCISFRQQSC